MFELSLAQSQSVLPVDLHEQAICNHLIRFDVVSGAGESLLPSPLMSYQFNLVEVAIAIDPDVQFPPPKG